jgi:hypothetical protein
MPDDGSQQAGATKGPSAVKVQILDRQGYVWDVDGMQLILRWHHSQQRSCSGMLVTAAVLLYTWHRMSFHCTVDDRDQPG